MIVSPRTGSMEPHLLREGGALCWQLTVTHCDLPCALAGV
ncbi:hypothetical protein T4D_79 [Trichinella pseudospiralis]|uniref:Uncharacterized protein n=1 Tax=Trichinella pseudospiralis TaxID=6337 RepID=A0A0V1E0N6_TRIPS|nr:hypothetical protein T4D_79 [Trichinella pseudospiralis]